MKPPDRWVNIEREATLVAGLVDAQAGVRRPIAPGKMLVGLNPTISGISSQKIPLGRGWVVLLQVPDMLLVSGVG